MNKIFKLMTVLAFVFAGMQTIAQEADNEGYVLMKVKSDILDCPHFSVLLPQELEMKKKIKLTKTDNKTYMLFKAKNYSDSTSNEFYQVVKEIYFPTENIVELIVKEDYDEVMKLINE
jgi:hypothetical protein